MELLSVGYGRWDASRRMAGLCASLVAHGVTTLVDVRHSPCAASLDPRSNYRPKDWNLQPDGRGIEPALREVGVRYVWLVELGNPQKHDPAMAVLRAHLAAPDGWPVHRGLAMLEAMVRADGARCCVMCACARYDECHRKLVVEAMQAAFARRGEALSVLDIG